MWEDFSTTKVSVLTVILAFHKLKAGIVVVITVVENMAIIMKFMVQQISQLDG